MPMEDDSAPAVLDREIATTADGRDVTRGYVSSTYHLWPQDELLRTLGGGYGGHAGYRLYEELLQDDRVYAALAQRRSAVVARETEVVPGGTSQGDKDAAKFIEDVLEHIRWDTLTERMHYGIHYGFSVAECLWTMEDNRVIPERIAVRNRRRFVFGTDYQPRLITYSDPQGEELPPRKFWHFATGTDNDDEPYGRGLGYYLYWPVWFKKNQVAFWLAALERFGTPTTVGKHHKNATPRERQTLLEAVRAVHRDNGVVIPEDMMIELLQTARSGTLDYDAFHNRMQDIITMVILSQTMTSEDGSSLSQAKVHMEVRKELVEADANLICDSFNRQVVRWLTEWNFPEGTKPPRVQRVMDEPPDTNQLSERDYRLFQMGWRPTREYIEAAYNVDVEEKAVSAPPANGMPPGEEEEGDEFAEIDDPVERALEALIEAAGDEAAQSKLHEDLVRPILAAAREDPDTLLGRLAELEPNLDTEGLEDLLTRLLFVAEVWGRLNGLDDA